MACDFRLRRASFALIVGEISFWVAGSGESGIVVKLTNSRTLQYWEHFSFPMFLSTTQKQRGIVAYLRPFQIGNLYRWPVVHRLPRRDKAKQGIDLSGDEGELFIGLRVRWIMNVSI